MQHFDQSQIALISQDNYYFDRAEQHKDVNGEINFDLPTAIDRQKLNTDIDSLVSGEAIIKTEYTFNNPSAVPKTITIEPAPVLIIEGLFVFHFQELAAKMDLKVYVDALEEVKLKRRILRDLTERGYPESDVRYRWKNHVMPAYQKYLQPHKIDCDLVINNNLAYAKGMRVLVDHLKSILA